jgi:hypothetical protein
MEEGKERRWERGRGKVCKDRRRLDMNVKIERERVCTQVCFKETKI